MGLLVVNKDALIKQLRIHEGVRRNPYRDTKGILTVGVGHNMEANPLPSDWKFPLTDVQINLLLSKDIDEIAKAPLDKNIPWYKSLNDARQNVLLNMCFNMGWTTLSKFKNTLSLVQRGMFPEASKAMLQSKWAKDVGNRAVELAKIMEEGVL